MTKLQELGTSIQQYLKSQNALKQTFLKMIKDKSIPLEQRWEFWCDAPSSLKDFSQFSVKFACMGKSFHWYHDLFIERYQTTYLDDLVADLEQYVHEQCTDDEQVFCCKLFRNAELLDRLKEEILARNLEYFTYDW